MQLAAFDTATPLYFRVTAYYNGYFSKNIGEVVSAQGETISDIDLGTVNISVLTLSGTINVTCGGNPVSQVTIYAYRWGSSIAYTQVSSPGSDAAWSIIIPPFDTPTDITFRVCCYLNSMELYGVYIENLAPGITNQDRTEIAINLGDIPNPLESATPLGPDTWVNGDIIESYVVDWYSITVSENTTYYLWWNDCYSGDRNQSLDGNQIFYGDDMGYDPCEFTVDSNGMVYIKVYNYGGGGNTGTYQIVYSTGSSRPGL